MNGLVWTFQAMGVRLRTLAVMTGDAYRSVSTATSRTTVRIDRTRSTVVRW